MKNILFEESQKMRQWWIWVLLLGLDGLFLYGIVQQIVMGVPFGDKPAPDAVLVLFSLIPLGLTYLIFATRLQTNLTNQGVELRFSPFAQPTFIAWSEIQNAYTRQYKPLSEFGGWGVRIGRKGTAYNISGNQGLQLELKSGSSLLIGTQRPDEIQSVLKNLGFEEKK